MVNVRQSGISGFASTLLCVTLAYSMRWTVVSVVQCLTSVLSLILELLA